MALAPGTRLGTYEVAGAIGAGGMGEVYRARDLKLDRDVALKILPSAFATDPDRLARFEREAKTLAALNHPLIAQIYGIEDSTGVRALVMELVDGETLDARIGGLSVAEALALAKQIAEALHAAHEQGIIHRDLKPANIKVRSDGTIKVLDFGLAKLSVEAGAASGSGGPAAIEGLTQSPTLTLAATQAGIILGTAGYMSPEQAKGRAADKRSDLWSFGCVLYEMLSGRRAFEGEDVSDTLASVLKSEPDWSALPPELPTAIKTMLQRCLVKDRRARVADIAVVQFVLAEASALTGPPKGGPHIEYRAAKAGHSVRRLMPIAGAVLITAALAAIAAWRWWPRPEPLPVSRFTIVLPQDQQFSNTGRQMIALSHDGKQLAYVANNRLYLRAISDQRPRAIAGSDSTNGVILNPVFSPDGQSLAFFALADNTLKRLSVVGGVPVTVCRSQGVPYGMSWDESGILYADGSRGILRCPSSGGMPEPLVKVEPEEFPQSPQMLPGGTSVLFTLARANDAAERWDKAQVIVQSLDTGRRTTAINGGSDARYLPTGHLLYALRGVAFAIPFDATAGAVTGAAVPVVEGVRRSPVAAGTGVAQIATSATGTLIYLPGPADTSNSQLRIALNDRMGTLTRLAPAPAQFVHLRASRDGARLAIDTDDGKTADVWIYDMAGGTALRRLTTTGKNRFPIWSPDGLRVAFQSDREGDLAIFAQRADGTGSVERLTKPENGIAHIPESWSPDGRFISLSVVKDSMNTLSILTVADHTIAPFGNVQSTEPPGSVFSPDGRWLAYHALRPEDRARALDSGGTFVQTFPASGGIYPAPRMGRDFQPLWSRDGKELYYVPLAANGRIAAVRVMAQSGLTFGNPETFPATIIAGRTSGLRRAFDVLPDGRFVGPVPADQTTGEAGSDSEIRIVLNWFDELKARVPATH